MGLRKASIKYNWHSSQFAEVKKWGSLGFLERLSFLDSEQFVELMEVLTLEVVVLHLGLLGLFAVKLLKVVESFFTGLGMFDGILEDFVDVEVLHVGLHVVQSLLLQLHDVQVVGELVDFVLGFFLSKLLLGHLAEDASELDDWEDVCVLEML
jgi:hypothetical protein